MQRQPIQFAFCLFGSPDRLCESGLPHGTRDASAPVGPDSSLTNPRSYRLTRCQQQANELYVEYHEVRAGVDLAEVHLHWRGVPIGILPHTTVRREAHSGVLHQVGLLLEQRFQTVAGVVWLHLHLRRPGTVTSTLVTSPLSVRRRNLRLWRPRMRSDAEHRGVSVLRVAADDEWSKARPHDDRRRGAQQLSRSTDQEHVDRPHLVMWPDLRKTQSGPHACKDVPVPRACSHHNHLTLQRHESAAKAASDVPHVGHTLQATDAGVDRDVVAHALCQLLDPTHLVENDVRTLHRCLATLLSNHLVGHVVHIKDGAGHFKGSCWYREQRLACTMQASKFQFAGEFPPPLRQRSAEKSLEVAAVHPAVALERLPVSELPLREQDGIATRATQRSQRREASETTTNHDSIEVQIHGHGKGRQRITATACDGSHAHAA
mmetsp:Transcript_25999/g.68220  ORF Transcript_25999/g.68220 Transcript_25999/m.68220 type:complete len:433 (+) Transcript_25999:44-1342(+)